VLWLAAKPGKRPLVGLGVAFALWASLHGVFVVGVGVVGLAAFGRWLDDRRPEVLRRSVAVGAVALLAPLAAGMIQMAISRTREYDADEDGATLTGDPLALASALRKLEIGVSKAPLAPQRDIVNASHMMIANPFRAQDVSRFFSTHPPMAERIARLEAMATGYRGH